MLRAKKLWGSSQEKMLPVQSLRQEFYVRQESEETCAVSHWTVQLQMYRVRKGILTRNRIMKIT